MKNFLENIFEVSHNKHSTIRPMEGLRGFAVFLVFLVHYASLCEPYVKPDSITYHLSKIIHDLGYAGVDLFFVLSGFLIYGMLLKKKQNYWSYLMRRVQRIYPVFIVVFVLYLFLSFAIPSESKIPDEPNQAFIYILQNFFLLPGIFDIQAMITVAWSLSYEFFFYLITPLVITLLFLRKWRFQYRILLLAIISVIGFIYFMENGGPIRMLMFVSGMILYEVTSHTSMAPMKHLGGIVIIIALAAIALLPLIDIHPGFRYVILFISMSVLCWECFTTAGFTQKLFSWGPLRWYGNMSYSYYLIHGATLKGVFMVVGFVIADNLSGQWLYWVLITPAFISTLLVSSFLFALVEKPYSLSRKVVSDKRIQSAAAADLHAESVETPKTS